MPAPHQRAFAADGLWPDRTIADRAQDWAQSRSDDLCLIDPQGAMTMAEVWGEAMALASALRARGLVRGDVVAFQLPNWREAAVLNLAAALSGLVLNPIVPIYRDAEMRIMLGDCGARAIFVPHVFRKIDYLAMARRVQADLPELTHIFTVRGQGADDYGALIAAGAALPAARESVDPQSISMVLYTSGTTGRPKGVLHSHATLGRIIEQSAAYWGLGRGDAVLMPSPVTHVSGYANGLAMPFVAGTQTVLMESWNAEEALALIHRHQVVGTVAATPFLVELAHAALAAGDGLPSLRFFACGGAAVAPEVIAKARKAFAHCAPFRVFGSSEVPLVTFGWPDAPELAAATDGRIVDYQVRIVDEAGHDLPDGQEGEILARGPAMMVGYADPAQTAEALDDQGYFRTGDLGRRDARGGLTITGRKKDLIIRGGENISATEIEQVLLTHPAVADCAVVAMPHPRLGEGVCAFVVGQGAGQAADLAAHVAQSGLAKQKIPERFEWVESLPRTASGKIRKDRLRADIAERIKAEAGG
ncbi:MULTISPECIES: AMP-binding protein [unclassified Novosphingobium]|uniref:AMP-binding protein n=1 Tax=unclassified Novosphingobium TaxID=2644732 RepID=UPI000868A0CF|nr:acyl-CoA synthetase (AMP-forming)/AMP-acid ligase II [Novosphingobium sp. 1748]ODU79319.1 MAG: cyclohexanecarboxylate-CoA ligase [Novosphingobium sp. SCN 63-17]OJX93189.1 MAG: cyclohexanecarboxylate-CoA ligase [Novosphingobium sp. 63-713]